MGLTILCISRYSPAQITRNMILERAGYSIVSVVDPKEAVQVFTGSAVHAVVFGDSIPSAQRLELALKFKSLNKSVPIVALSNSSGSQFAAGIVDEQLESLGDPHLLLEALQRVLARDGDGQTVNGAGPKNPDSSVREN
jgi:CheY-like chemotaxis protein